MKTAVLIIFTILSSTRLTGQEFRISIAPTSDIFHRKIVGYRAYDSQKTGFSSKLNYIFATKKRVNIGVGIGYQNSTTLKVVPVNPIEYLEAQEKVHLVSLSLNSIYKFQNEFYLELAPLMGLQLNYNSRLTTDNQTGLGLGFGVGSNFKINSFMYFNLEPRLTLFNVIPFNNLDSPYRLSVAELNLGLVFGKNIIE